MTAILIISLLAFVALIMFLINHFAKKADAKKAQKMLDQNIERALMDELLNNSISFLAQHSNIDKIAGIIAARIQDCLKLGIHPEKLAKLLEQFDGVSKGRNWTDKEIKMSVMIQQYLLQNIDSYDLEVYMLETCKDHKDGFDKLNKTLLAKAKKNYLIWSPIF